MVLNPDLYLVVGLSLAVLTIPVLLAAFRDGRPPRLASLLIIVSGVMLVLALSKKPGGYEMQDIPGAFYRVVVRPLQ